MQTILTRCALCKGRGKVICTHCQGSGKAPSSRGPRQAPEPCPHCQGSGWMCCLGCLGSGYVEMPALAYGGGAARKLKFKESPEGMEHGQRGQ